MNTRTYPRTPAPVAEGDRYGLYTVIREVERHRKPNGAAVRMVLARCDCGTERQVRLSSLREGHTVSCGCFHRAQAKVTLPAASVTHGQSKTRLYMVWTAMKARCHNPADKSFGRYGARGVRVCEEWRGSFEAFAAHVGPRPDGMTLDRINPAGNYEPGNVRWATYTQQARNTRRNVWVDAGGVRMTLAEACQSLGMPYEKARRAIRGTGEFNGVRYVG